MHSDWLGFCLIIMEKNFKTLERYGDEYGCKKLQELWKAV